MECKIFKRNKKVIKLKKEIGRLKLDIVGITESRWDGRMILCQGITE